MLSQLFTIVRLRAVTLKLHIQYEWTYFTNWILKCRLARAQARRDELREEIIREGGAQWLADYDTECDKLDEEERDVA